MDRPFDDAQAAPQAASWEMLMAAAQAGDGKAYDRLLRQLLPLLRGVARRRISNAAEAEDAVQDTLLTLHAVRHTYQPDRPLRPWVLTICERRCVDRLRLRRRHAQADAAGPEALATIAAPGMEEAGQGAVLRGELHAMVASLPRAQRVAVTLTKLQDLSLVQASAASGLSVGAIKVACFRGVRALRARLAEAA